MSGKYRYDHRTVKKHHFVGIGVGVSILILAGIVSLVAWDLNSNESTPVEGTRTVVGQVTGDNTTKTIDEDFFSFRLPVDWKETARTKNTTENSITWTSTKKANTARSLKIYIDLIPKDLPINRLLPVAANGSGISSEDVSENCATFTQGGTLDVSKAVKLQPSTARWKGTDFICNLPNVVDNQVGTSSRDGINQVNVSGPTKGKHTYFFLYTDRNIQADYSILFEALNTFQAK